MEKWIPIVIYVIKCHISTCISQLAPSKDFTYLFNGPYSSGKSYKSIRERIHPLLPPMHVVFDIDFVLHLPFCDRWSYHGFRQYSDYFPSVIMYGMGNHSH